MSSRWTSLAALVAGSVCWVAGCKSTSTAAQQPIYAYGAKLENTAADCAVPGLPEPAQLPKLDKLPDPFTKLDGTRLAKKSEWRCRRQEILAQAEKYIYGQKPPRPAKVTGSVTNSELAVDV